VNETTIDLEKTEEEILTCGASDEELESAAGVSAGMQGAASLWSTNSPIGCTCVNPDSD
jgi:hypothetical protein